MRDRLSYDSIFTHTRKGVGQAFQNRRFFVAGSISLGRQLPTWRASPQTLRILFVASEKSLRGRGMANRESVTQILHDDLGLHTDAKQWMPHDLTGSSRYGVPANLSKSSGIPACAREPRVQSMVTRHDFWVLYRHQETSICAASRQTLLPVM
jgi:hypothetical protein